MHSHVIQPPVLPMAIWLNAARNGQVSYTDAANACETITQSTSLNGCPSRNAWLGLTQIVQESSQSCIATLPSPGDPAGLPIELLVRMQTDFGAIATGNSWVVYHDVEHGWSMHHTQHRVRQPDHAHSRKEFLSTLEQATAHLASADLVGDRKEIDLLLEQLDTIALPPSINSRQLDFLHQAIRVRIVSQAALTQAHIPSSPSADRRRIAVLQQVENCARNLMSAIASQ